jgi:hypothetical protein
MQVGGGGEQQMWEKAPEPRWEGRRAVPSGAERAGGDGARPSRRGSKDGTTGTGGCSVLATASSLLQFMQDRSERRQRRRRAGPDVGGSDAAQSGEGGAGERWPSHTAPWHSPAHGNTRACHVAC